MKTKIYLIFLVALFLSISCKEEPPKADVQEIAAVKQWNPEDTRSITGLMAERGLVSKTDANSPGYVLFQPSSSVQTYLINKEGDVVHTWTGELNSMQSYLLDNGNLIRLERDVDFPTFAAGGQSGRIREYDWDGNMLWDFEYANATELTHHDFEVMPNGNILAIAYDAKTAEEAAAAGRDPESTPAAGIWPDKIIEVKPTYPSGGEIVWEWHMWDHLVQDFDETKDNYGVVSENPRRININVHGGEGGPPMSAEQIEDMKKHGLMTSNASVDNQGSDITHSNAISYNERLDQIAISVPGYCEIFVIDHSTTTEEAKGSTGGRWGHGGDLLYRWGNPANYGMGTEEDMKLFFQHDVKWIPEGYPGAGNLMVFNNDIVHPDNKLPSVWAALMGAKSPDPQIPVGEFGNYSAVYEISAPVNKEGGYILEENKAFGPEETFWSYTAPDTYSFYSPFVSGAQRLSNGHTLITSGAQGRFFEIDKDKNIVWEYWNPYQHNYRLPDGSVAQPTGPFLYAQFRSTHFSPDHPAFAGKELKPIEPQPEPFIFVPPPMPADTTQAK